MVRRSRLKDIGGSVQRERLHRVTTALGQPPVVVSVAGTTVSITIPDRMPLTKNNLVGLSNILKEKADEVSHAVGDNWYPAGFVWLNVDGNSDIVKLFKREGTVDRNGNYEIEGVGYIMKNYDRGYSLHFRFPQRTATEQQSLNYNTPMYQIAQQVLARMGVRSSLYSNVD